MKNDSFKHTHEKEKIHSLYKEDLGKSDSRSFKEISKQKFFIKEFQEFNDASSYQVFKSNLKSYSDIDIPERLLIKFFTK